MAGENTVVADIDAELMKWIEDDNVPQEISLGDAAAEVGDAFGMLLEKYNKEEPVNIYGSLSEDDRLLAVLTEGKEEIQRVEREDAPAKDIERAYTDFLNAYFKAAKLINPLGGFGKERMKKALEILRNFEAKHWPLVTRITPDNAKVYRDLIPDEHYDDIVVGRKRALGAIRMKAGRSRCAGVVIYRVDVQTITNAPVIKLDWIYVAEEFRRQGVANMLMAELTGLALQDDEAFISVNMNIPDASDKEKQEEFEALEGFIRSWNFRLSVDAGGAFYINLDLLKDNKYFKEPPEGVSSLGELGLSGREMIQRFFRQHNKDYDERMRVFAYEHYDFFDPDVSCAIVTGGVITAIFLVHRYMSGNYRYEIMRFSHNTDPVIILQMLRHGYRRAVAKGDGNGMLFGGFESSEGYMTTAKLIPDTLILTRLTGVLLPPRSKETVSSTDWARLRKEAGFK